MNVIESNNITSTISYLRQNVYILPEFKTLLISNLNKSINADEVYFTPDQYGGWTINVKFDSSKNNTNSSNSSDFYLIRVTVALHNTLISLKEARPDISNLVNVTVVGSDNIVIKI